MRLLPGNFFEDVAEELEQACAKHAPLNSHHEAYSVILEEVEEYWEEVRKRRSQRDPDAMYQELVQIAAMAARAAIDCQPAELEGEEGDRACGPEHGPSRSAG